MKIYYVMRLLLISGLVALLTAADRTAYGAAASPRPIIIQSPFAGSWYPATPVKLTALLAKYAANCTEQPKIAHPIALILPHAGYIFSGQTAMYGISQLRHKSYDRVIIIGTSHLARLKNQITIPKCDFYATPLGKFPLDHKAISQLGNTPYIADSSLSLHQREHSVQMIIPLLQYAKITAPLVPIACGQLDRKALVSIGQLLKKIITPQTLLIVSSDFTHYGPNYGYLPFNDHIAANLKALDMGAWATIKAESADSFIRYCQSSGDTICGRNPIALLLTILPSGSKATLLHYDTSGNITGNYTNSVSYMAIAFSGKWPDSSVENSATAVKRSPSGLNLQEKRQLLKLARQSINYFLNHKRRPTPALLGIKLTPAMKKPRGAFVTLHENGQLRGCIGEILPRRPLYQVIIDRAISAAFEDYRFSPLRRNEFNKITIEISVLTPPHTIASYRDIVLGRDGIILSKAGHSAVFLPQVAPEQHWNLPTTLSYLARKAGLPADAWQHGATFKVFQADIFNEKELSHQVHPACRVHASQEAHPRVTWSTDNTRNFDNNPVFCNIPGAKSRGHLETNSCFAGGRVQDILFRTFLKSF